MYDVLILADLEIGHILATIKMAVNLQKGGFKVCYLTVPDAKKIIEQNNQVAFSCFEEFYPAGKVSEMRRKYKSSNRYLEDPGHLYLSIISGSLDKIIEEINPGIILSSRFVALEALLIHYRHQIPQIIYHTLLFQDNNLFKLRG
ncbi:MAG TPA: hypothetical protein VFE50_13945 [Cyclobacteriaceae bacterium]|nr:hypothetical protein [Cyclobacteriaceae bacterium]